MLKFCLENANGEIQQISSILYMIRGITLWVIWIECNYEA